MSSSGYRLPPARPAPVASAALAFTRPTAAGSSVLNHNAGRAQSYASAAAAAVARTSSPVFLQPLSPSKPTPATTSSHVSRSPSAAALLPISPTRIAVTPSSAAVIATPIASPSPPAARPSHSPSSNGDAFLVPRPLTKDLPHLIIRRLQLGDYAKGHCTLLGQLTSVGTISQQAYEQRVQAMAACGPTYTTLVIEDLTKQQVIATATLVVEMKLIHSCGAAGHVEDVVVSDAYRGQQLGAKIMDALVQVGRAAKCYKVILDCAEKNMPFYEKLGYRASERHMRLDL